jgi:serine/threonine protein kinase
MDCPPHQQRACPQALRRRRGSGRAFTSSLEYIEGQTLAQWMIDHPKPDLNDRARASSSQVAKGLQAFHRLEMVHQDLKPDNIMIDAPAP